MISLCVFVPVEVLWQSTIQCVEQVDDSRTLLTVANYEPRLQKKHDTLMLDTWQLSVCDNSMHGCAHERPSRSKAFCFHNES